MLLKKTLCTILCMTAMIILRGILIADPGDCNGDGKTNASDAVIIANYLSDMGYFLNSPEDCDCDGHQGITYGDLIQIMEYVFSGASVYPAWGDDLIEPCGVEFYFNNRINFGTAQVVDTVTISVRVPGNFNVRALSIPFSFAAEDGQMEVTCTAIDFSGTVGSGLGASIHNAEKIILLVGNPVTDPLAISPGSQGLLFKAIFTKDVDGEPNDLRLSKYNRSWPLILRKLAYDGVDGERIYFPEVIRAPYGDVNCDGVVSISDPVLIINYIFLGGNPPGNCEYQNLY